MEARFLPAGDCAMLVQLGDAISLEVNGRVLGLYEDLKKDPVEGIVEMVPTYASLMVQYRPDKVRFQELKKILEVRAARAGSVSQTRKVIREVPICYEGDLAPDLEECARLQGTTTDEIIRMHSSHDYYVYMLGFAPGHPYSARFEEPFSFRRRETARLSIPGGSVVVQQNLSDLIPFDQPCGWNIVGTTPVTITDFRREDPFLVHAGEWVRYIPVSRREYDRIKKEDAAGRYKVRTIEEA